MMEQKRLISAITSLIIAFSASGTGLTANARTDTDKQDEQSINTTETSSAEDYEMTVGEVLKLQLENMFHDNIRYEIKDNEIAGYGINGQSYMGGMEYLEYIVAKSVGETTYDVIDTSDNSVIATGKIKVKPVNSVDIPLSDPLIKVESVNGVAQGIVSIKTSDDMLYHYDNDELIMVDYNVKDSYFYSTPGGKCYEYILRNGYNGGFLTLNGEDVFDAIVDYKFNEDLYVSDFSFDEQSNNLYVVTNNGTLWKSSCYDENPEFKAINEDCDIYAGHQMYYRKDGMLCHEEDGSEIGKINMVDYCSGVDQLGDCFSDRGEEILDDEGNVWLVEHDGYTEEGKPLYKVTLVSDEVSKIGTMVIDDYKKQCVYVKTDGKIYSWMDGKELKNEGKIISEELLYHNPGLIYNRSVSYPDVQATMYDDKTANINYKNDGIKITDVEDVSGCQTAALIVRTDGSLWRYAGGDTLSQINIAEKRYSWYDYEMTVGEVLELPDNMYGGYYDYVIKDNEIAGYGINGQKITNHIEYLKKIVAKSVGETTYDVVDMHDNSVVATRKIKVKPVNSVDLPLSEPLIKVESVNGVAEGIVSFKTTDDILYHYTNDELIKVDSNVKDSHIYSPVSGKCYEYIWYKDGILTLNGDNVFEDGVLVSEFTFDERNKNLYVVTNDGTLWKGYYYDKKVEFKAIDQDCDRYAGYNMYYRKDGMLCREEDGYEIGKINMVDFSSGVDRELDCLFGKGEAILDDEGNVWLVERDGYTEEGKALYKVTKVSDEVSRIGMIIIDDNYKKCVYVKTDGKIYSWFTQREVNYDGKIFTEEFGYNNSGLIYNRSVSSPDVHATIFDDKTANIKYKNDGIKITDVEDVFGCQTAALIFRTDGTLWRYAGGDTVSQVNIAASSKDEQISDPLDSQTGDGKPIVYGDVNGDRSVDIADIIQISMCLLHDIKFDNNQIKAVDFNENGEVDITELARVKQYIMKDKITLGPKK